MLSANSRGYLTTPQELEEIAGKAREGTKPYRTNVDDLMAYVKEPYYWPYGDLSGEVTVIGGSASVPAQLSREATSVVYGKALAYLPLGRSPSPPTDSELQVTRFRPFFGSKR